MVGFRRRVPALPPTPTRQGMLRAATLALGVLAPLAGAELLLRLHPSAYDGARMLPVNREHPIARFQPDREFTWSHGWNFSIVNTVQVNNAGFHSDVDYRADAPGPLLAVVGDSFVAALQVAYRQTCAGRLGTMLEPAGRVYSFGKGGAGLGQYLAYARYVRDTFRPQRLVVVVVRNDLIDPSLPNRVYPGFHYFHDRGGRLVLERVDFVPNLAHRLGRRSALVRYLAQNLMAADSSSVRAHRRTRPAGDDPAGTDRVTTASEPSERVIDAFLDLLPEYSGLGAERIALVVDGVRPELYDDEVPAGARGNLHDVTRRRFLANARRRGYETIDMQPRFRAHYRKHGRRFEWPQDYHWNALGHERCFEAVRSSKLLAGAFPAGPDDRPQPARTR